MLNAIKNKYETYTPGEFLPIREDGKIINMRAFHLYKAKKAALAIDRVFQHAIDRAWAK